jgi:hypothetical protein
MSADSRRPRDGAGSDPSGRSDQPGRHGQPNRSDSPAQSDPMGHSDTPISIGRLEELLADRALQGLSLEDERELDQLLAKAGDIDADAFDRAAAAVDLALGEQRFEPMPAALSQKIAAHTVLHSSQIRTARHSALAESARGARDAPAHDTRSTFVAWSGWIAAAAAVLVTVFLARRAPESTPPVQASIVQQLGQAKDRLSAAWKPTDDSASKSVHGDIVWSNALQKGYMRLSGLAKNDPSKQQYQLWIFDKNQDDKYPIDGGVFDIDAATGDVIVPIDAKIKVVSPKMFAVTTEKPGGVVVSAREHIVALAAL